MKIICDWENCKEPGSYKAPLEKDNSKKYRLLCLKHIKIFNKNWNYFENMNDQEIEYFIKSDLTWHKSTKSFGSSENFFKEGVKLFEKKKYKDAKFFLERSIVFDPKHANSYLYLAKIYKKEEDQKNEEKYILNKHIQRFNC